MPEHELVLALVAARGELLLEHGQHQGTEVDRAPGRLRLRALELAANERLANVQPPVYEVDVAPAEREQLAAPERRAERHVHDPPRERPPRPLFRVRRLLQLPVRREEP